MELIVKMMFYDETMTFAFVCMINHVFSIVAFDPGIIWGLFGITHQFLVIGKSKCFVFVLSSLSIFGFTKRKKHGKALEKT